ncbi:hypothetical protein D3C81_2319730 [compost metagenome]
MAVRARGRLQLAVEQLLQLRQVLGLVEQRLQRLGLAQQLGHCLRRQGTECHGERCLMG